MTGRRKVDKLLTMNECGKLKRKREKDRYLDTRKRFKI